MNAEQAERKRSYMKKYHREYHLKHREKRCAAARAYYHGNKDRARTYNREWRARNKDKRRAQCARYQAKHGDKIRSRQRASYRAMSPEKKRARSLKLLCGSHGLTVAAYLEMVRRQKGRCAVCREPPAKGKRLHIDHDHVTGKVRELLCLRCNVTLGHLERAPGLEVGLLRYLEAHRALSV